MDINTVEPDLPKHPEARIRLLVQHMALKESRLEDGAAARQWLPIVDGYTIGSKAKDCTVMVIT
jgi:hypothetical protein